MRFILPIGLLCLVACSSAQGTPDDGSAATEEDALDLEADAPDPARLTQLARLVSEHLDPELRADGVTNVKADHDKDGIADALEEDLLRRYRPYYRFSVDGSKVEGNRPADPVTELTYAQLKQLKGDDGTTDALPCGRASDHHLDPAASLYTCRPDASFSSAPVKSDYCLNIDNDRYGGVSFEEAKAKATGLLGHVVRDTVNGHDAYKIEYWQFYAFNNQDIKILGQGSFGDHEGDWTSVQVWLDREVHRLVKIAYTIHGKVVTFDIPDKAPTTRSGFVEVKGAHYDPNVGNFFDAKELPKYSDNQAEFWVDEHGYRHVVVYIERGGHEVWPGPWGHGSPGSLGPFTFHLNGHNGEGEHYLVPDITDRPFNVGEVDHPLTTSARLVLQYNGHWGCTNTKDVFGYAPQRRSPVGLPTHCEWRFPDRGPVAGCEH